jgi:hypothetical protein
MNRLFRSPLADTVTSFDNPMYRIPLGPTSLYDIFLDGHRFLEGADGAAGLHWLVVIPLLAIALVRRRPAEMIPCAALFAIYFVAVFVQQAYLRYLFPAFCCSQSSPRGPRSQLIESRATRLALLLFGGALVILNVRFIPSGNWPNAQLCPMCAFDRFAREDFTATYMGDRIVGDYLNRNLRDARVGFMMLNAPSPAGIRRLFTRSQLARRCVLPADGRGDERRSHRRGGAQVRSHPHRLPDDEPGDGEPDDEGLSRRAHGARVEVPGLRRGARVAALSRAPAAARAARCRCRSAAPTAATGSRPASEARRA